MRRLWHWLWSSSVRRQLITGVALVHMLLMSIFVFDLVHRQREFLAERARSRVVLQAETLAASSIQGAMSNDLGGLSEILVAVGKDSSVSRAMVTDSRGRVLADLRGKNIGLYRNDRRTSAIVSGDPQVRLVDQDVRSIEAAAPIVAHGQVIGWAWVARDFRAEQAYLAYVTSSGVVYTAAAILIGTVFAFLLAGRVTRQLQLLLAGTARLTANRIDESVPVITDNEVGQVTRSFNDAMQRLAKQQQALRESDERFRVAQELSPDGFLIFRPLRDNSGVVTDFLWIYENDGAARMNDTNPKEVCGKKVSEVLPHHDQSPFHKTYKEVAETGEVRIVEEAFDDQDTFREPRWFRVVVVPSGGDIAILVQNVTERKQSEEALRKKESALRESHERLERVLEVETVGVMFWDLNTGAMVDANDAFLTLMGYSRSQVEARELSWQKLTPPEYMAVSCAEIEKFLATGRVGPYEKEYFCKDGTRKWLLFAGSSLGDNQCVEFCIDISDRKKAELAMRQSEERLSSILENMSEGLVLFDAEGNITYQNPASLRIHGFGNPGAGGLEQQDLPAMWNVWDETGRPLSFEEWPTSRVRRGEHFQDQILRAMKVETGQEFYARYNGCPIIDANGRLTFGFVTIREITEQRIAEMAARESEERYRNLFQSMDEGFAECEVIYDAAGHPVDYRHLALNPAFEKVTGLSAEQTVGRTVTEVIPGIERSWIESYARTVQTGESRRIANPVAALGRQFELYVWRSGPGRFATVLSDVTERKRAAEELERTRNIMAEGQRIAHLGTFEYVAATQEILWSEEAYRIYGLDPHGPAPSYNAMLAQNVHPEDADRLHHVFTAAMQDQSVYELEHRIVRPDGSVRWVYDRAYPHCGENGKLVRYIGATLDITERKRSEEVLRESEARMRAVFRSLMEGIVFLNSQGEVEEINESVQRLHGHSLEELTSPEMDPRGRIIRSDGTRFPEDEQPAIVALRTGRPVRDVEMGVPGRDGSVRWRLVNAQPVRDDLGNLLGAVASFLDITERKQAEERLRASEERLRLANQVARIGSFEWDLQTQATVWSPELEALYGLPPGAIGGRSEEWASHVLPEDLPEVERRIREALDSGSFEAEWRVMRPDGTVRWIAGRGQVIKDEAGQSVRMLGVNLDITERKLAEAAIAESERRYRGLFESMQEAFFLGEVMFDEAGEPRDWRYLDVNPYFEAIYGRKREEVVGKTYREVLAGAHSDQWLEIAGRVTLTGNGESFAGKSNTGRYLEGTVYCPQPGQFAAIVMDATARRDAEEQIRRLNAELEDRVRRRTVQLEAANKELEAFAYSVSHDLRAPLRGIDGWSLALVEDYAKQLDDTAREYLDRVRSEAQRMGTLIDDMLHLSSITRSQMEKKPVDLSVIARTVAGRLRESHPDRGIEFVIPGRIDAEGDAGLLEIALTNLIGNAVKFTGMREEARIEFGGVELDGERTFFVRDNGVGFNMASAGKLFGAFQRFHKASDFPGTGIGLATVQRIIRRHGGRIWADAEIGKGATFYFTLYSK